MQPWALISPASRGIGLALTRRVLQTTRCPVVATARADVDRTKEEVLSGLSSVDEDRLTVLKLDVNDESTIAAAAEQCSKSFPKSHHHLHLALIVPGILFPEKSPRQIEYDDALLTLKTNTLGPLLMMKHFSPFLPTKKTELPAASETEADAYTGLPPDHAVWACMSARVGSVSDNRLGGWYSYRASKAALNQAVRTFDNHLRTAAGDKAIAVGLHPGTVKTGLSKEFWASVKDKLFEKDWVAERLVGLLTGTDKDVKAIGLEGRGRCWDWKGDEVPP